MTVTSWKARAQGATGMVATALALTAATPVFWPDHASLDPFARVLEHLMPQMAVAACLACLLLAALGVPRTAAGVAVLALAGGFGVPALRHVPGSQTVPPASALAQEAGLRVLWINMLWSNATDPVLLADRLADAPADIVFVAEAEPLRPVLDRLARSFPHMIGCALPRRCEILVLSRRSDVTMAFADPRFSRPERFAVVELPAAFPNRPEGLTLLGLHFYKPWFGDMADQDDWHTVRLLGERAGALVVLGDFNAAPWSLRMLRLRRLCDLSPPRHPPATWPAAAGAFGVPIDLALTRGGAVLRRVTPWTALPGSDHRGLLIEIGHPASATGRVPPPPPGCEVPPGPAARLGL